MDNIENKEFKEKYIHPVVKKLLKKLKKIEAEFENAGPVRKQRLMKMYISTQKKLGIE